MVNLDSSISDEVSHKSRHLSRDIARLIGRKPLPCFLGTFLVCCILTVLVVTTGNFVVVFENNGWKSRGTTIGNREMQSYIILENREDLFWDDFLSNKFSREIQDTYSSPWDYMQENILSGETTIGKYGRRLNLDEEDQEFALACKTNWFAETNVMEKLLKRGHNQLIAVWKFNHGADDTASNLDSKVLVEMCQAEMVTNKVMSENGFCDSCEDEVCPPPSSLVSVVWLALEEMLNLKLDTCEELSAAYTPVIQEIVTSLLIDCTDSLRKSSTKDGNATCSIPGFSPHLVDKDFGVGETKRLDYASTIFYNSHEIGEDEALRMYQLYDSFGKGDERIITSTYDTNDQDLSELHVKEYLVRDTIFAFASSLVTSIAMYIHTRSLWLTIVGLAQILFAAPLSYCVYYFCIGLSYFPVINFIGLFVSAALGADDLFVAVDKWKNARILNPSGTTEDVAEEALPSAAGAMLLTTSTTGVAFFATCITPVPPIFTFALFCGLTVIFNYILNLLLVFPALCLYDKWLTEGSRNCVVSTSGRKIELRHDEEDDTTRRSIETNEVLIHRILSAFYIYLHQYRFLILIIFAGLVIITLYFASTIKLPDNSDVRMLPSNNAFEQHYEWSRLLLSSELVVSTSIVRVFWGIEPSDTGDYRNPNTKTTLELDENFDPKSKEAQEYLKGFCDRFWGKDFVYSPRYEYKCPMNAFEDWLIEQSTLSLEAKHSTYAEACDDANSIPMNEKYFHSCFNVWSNGRGGNSTYNSQTVLSRDGILNVMWCEARASIRFNDPYVDLQKEYGRYESFLQDEMTAAPAGVNHAFQTSSVWWWKDTTGQMLSTAISAAIIAIIFSTIVVFFSSRCLRLTLFSGLCIAYVLAAATSCLVGIGWELGFLESVCFSILIGISCDFVVHFGHAYLQLPGSQTKEARTKAAVIHMGPSILASAFTTFAAALVMLFCHLSFFTKFAQMLLFTILHAIIGSFVCYLVLTDTFGPREPTKLYDSVIAWLTSKMETTMR